jgi:hypothetical protein
MKDCKNRTSKQCPSLRDLDRPSSSRSSSQSPSNNSHDVTTDWGHGHPNAPMQGQTSGEQDGRSRVAPLEPAMRNDCPRHAFEQYKSRSRASAVTKTTTLHMNTSLLEPGLVPYFSADDRMRTILDYRSYRPVNRIGNLSCRTRGRIAEYANRVRSQTPINFSGVPAVSRFDFFALFVLLSMTLESVRVSRYKLFLTFSRGL